jgi:acyl carrier protein
MSTRKEEIREELAAIFRQVLGCEIAAADFQTDSGLIEKLHIDSLLGLQIIVKIEQKFNLIIEDDNFAIQMLNSLGQAAEFIEKSMGRGCA